MFIPPWAITLIFLAIIAIVNASFREGYNKGKNDKN